MTDKQRFDELTKLSPQELHIKAGVGTLSEKYLHALLKRYFEPDTDYHEVGIDRFTADICRDMSIIEIQTRALGRLREKLEYYLLEGYKVKVVYPIPHIKWLSWIDPDTGEASPKHRSPKTGSFYDCFWELYNIKYFLDWDNLSVELMLIDVLDYKNLNGYGKRRKIRATRQERFPVALHDTLILDSPKDYLKLVPQELPEIFTKDDYAKAAKLSPEIAYSGLNILQYLEVVELVGKDGRKKLYRRRQTQ